MRKSTMKCLLVFLSARFLASTAYGTPQFPEKLHYKDKLYRLACAPLEKYFDANHPKPEEMNRSNSACWRGYVATWEIKDKQLYLKSLWQPWSGGPFWRYGDSESEGEIPLSLIFKDKKSPVKATWYTGVLRLLDGKRVGSVRFLVRPRYPIVEDLYISAAGYDRGHHLYEKGIYLGVVKGRIVSEYVVDNTKEGATRTVRDWAWVASASEPVKDDFKWFDLRLVASDAFSRYKESGKSFRTRGIYYVHQKGNTPRIWMPPTLATPQLLVLLNSLPRDFKGGECQHVEVRAHFEQEHPFHCLLHVDSIRPLKPGETMHHPDFKAATKKR